MTILTHRVTEGNLSALRFDSRTLKESCEVEIKVLIYLLLVFIEKCSTSLNYCVWMYRSRQHRCSVEKAFLRNFIKFLGKHLCQTLFLNKVAGLRQHLFSNAIFYRTPLVAAFDLMQISKIGTDFLSQRDRVPAKRKIMSVTTI